MQNISAKLIFSPFKIGNMFSLKDQVPKPMKSYVIDNFSCDSCDACYIGETTRYLSTRITEHLCTDKVSHAYNNLQTFQQCKDQCPASCFDILDCASTKYQLKIKEGLHITWEKPSLNKQVKSFSMSITV